MKRFLCLIFTALILLSLTVPIAADIPDYENLPPLDMDNTTIEYDFENVFFNDYQLEDFKYNSEKSGVEFITMAEKSYTESNNLLNMKDTTITATNNTYKEQQTNLSVEPSTTYTLAFDYEFIEEPTIANASQKLRVAGYIREGTNVARMSGKNFDNYTKGRFIYNFTTKSSLAESYQLFFRIPESDSKFTCKLNISNITLVKGNYSELPYEPYGVSTDYGLYFYLYNPSQLKIVKDSAYNLIQFGSNVTGGIKNDPRYKQHQMKLIDTYGATDEEGDTTDALILKFCLLNYDDFIFDENFTTRFYDVSGVELMLEGESTSKEYSVAKVFEFYYSPLGLPVCTVQSTNVIRLDELAFSYYRVESEIKNHYKDIQSVSFSIPNDFINKYGELTQLHAVWEECLTQPVLIANDAKVVNEFKKVLNQEVPSDFKYSFLFDVENFYSHPFLNRFMYTFKNQYNSNLDLKEKIIETSFIGFDRYVSEYLPSENTFNKLYFVEYSENVFDSNAVCVTSEKMIQNLDNYLWADEVFAEIDDTNFDLQNPKLFDVTYLNELGTYRAPTLWESIFKAGGNALIKDDGNPIIYSSIDTIDKSYLTDKDNADLFVERYKVYKDDVDDIKAVSSDNSTTYIVRYAVTDYIVNQAFIYEEGSDKPVCDAIVGQAEAIRNFDFIDMYFTKDDVVTCFAVGMDKQNFISDYTGADVKYTPDRWAELLAFLEKCFAIAIIFTVISIALKLFTLFKRTKVKVVINERRRR